jgi:hypothetical protein
MFFANRPIEERIERPPLLFELLLKTANPLLVRRRRKSRSSASVIVFPSRHSDSCYR